MYLFLSAGGAAEKAGLHSGDKIIKVSSYLPFTHYSSDTFFKEPCINLVFCIIFVPPLNFMLYTFFPNLYYNNLFLFPVNA